MVHSPRRLRMIVMVSVIQTWFDSNVASSHDGAPLRGVCMTCRMGEHATHAKGIPSPFFYKIIMKKMGFLIERALERPNYSPGAGVRAGLRIQPSCGDSSGQVELTDHIEVEHLLNT